LRDCNCAPEQPPFMLDRNALGSATPSLSPDTKELKP